MLVLQCRMIVPVVVIIRVSVSVYVDISAALVCECPECRFWCWFPDVRIMLAAKTWF